MSCTGIGFPPRMGHQSFQIMLTKIFKSGWKMCKIRTGHIVSNCMAGTAVCLKQDLATFNRCSFRIWGNLFRFLPIDISVFILLALVELHSITIEFGWNRNADRIFYFNLFLRRCIEVNHSSAGKMFAIRTRTQVSGKNNIVNVVGLLDFHEHGSAIVNRERISRNGYSCSLSGMNDCILSRDYSEGINLEA